MTEEKEEAVVFLKNAYFLQLMHIGGITSDGRDFPLTVERERLESDVGSIAQEETTLEEVLPEVFPVIQDGFQVIDRTTNGHEWTRIFLGENHRLHGIIR